MKRSCSGFSEEAQRPEAGGPVAADHQVVVNGDAQGAGGFDDFLGHGDVGLGRRRVAGWMVVDHPYGPHNVLIYMIYFA